MKYTLNQAARATGKKPSTIHHALKKGRISGVKADNGNWEIDPAELHRVYPALSDEYHNETPQSNAVNPPVDIENILRIKELEAELKYANKRITDLEKDLYKIEKQRDDWQHHARTLLLSPPPSEPPTFLEKWGFGRVKKRSLRADFAPTQSEG